MRRHRLLAVFPSALLLAAGYAYTAIVLGFRINVSAESRLAHYSAAFTFVCAAFALWHILGYYGFIPDQPRKVGYLASAAWLGGFALVLFADRIVLAAGYVGAACAVALFSYWRYPRRSEST